MCRKFNEVWKFPFGVANICLQSVRQTKKRTNRQTRSWQYPRSPTGVRVMIQLGFHEFRVTVILFSPPTASSIVRLKMSTKRSAELWSLFQTGILGVRPPVLSAAGSVIMVMWRAIHYLLQWPRRPGMTPGGVIVGGLASGGVQVT